MKGEFFIDTFESDVMKCFFDCIVLAHLVQCRSKPYMVSGMTEGKRSTSEACTALWNEKNGERQSGIFPEAHDDRTILLPVADETVLIQVICA